MQAKEEVRKKKAKVTSQAKLSFADNEEDEGDQVACSSALKIDVTALGRNAFCSFFHLLRCHHLSTNCCAHVDLRC